MSDKALPIYDGQEHSLPPLAEGNAGLHFARLYDGYYTQDESSAKGDFLQKFADMLGDADLLQQHALRQTALAKAAQGDVRIYTLDGHFVTGMGNAHPVENGFQWHYTLGVPYLAGSQVKGMMRSMIERYFAGTAQEKQALLLKWFGSDKKKKENRHSADPTAQSGELIFFDALPYAKPTLTLDVMTPHMGDWYAQGGQITNLHKDRSKLPADWHDPVPIPFLSVKNASFIMSIGKRRQSAIDLDDVWQVLDQALTYLGAGGKTNTGFGYMRYDAQKTDDLHQDRQHQQAERSKAAELAQAQAQSSPFHIELMRIALQQGWQENKDEAKTRFTEALCGEWLDKLEANPDEHESISLIVAIAEQHYSKQMKNPEHKKVKPNQRAWIKRLKALTERQP